MKYGQQAEANTTSTNVSVALNARGSGFGRAVLGLCSAAGFAGSIRGRASDSHLVRCRRDQAPLPAVDVFDLKERRDSLEQRGSTGLRKPNQQEAMMRARGILPDIREVQILCDEEALTCLGGLPHDIVDSRGDVFRWHGVNVVPQRSKHRNESSRQILVELDPHRT